MLGARRYNPAEVEGAQSGRFLVSDQTELTTHTFYEHHQRSSRSVFNATFSWLFYCVAPWTVMIQRATLGSRLEKTAN